MTKLKIVFAVRDMSDGDNSKSPGSLKPIFSEGLDDHGYNIGLQQIMVDLDVDQLASMLPSEAKENLDAAGLMIGRFIAERLRNATATEATSA